MTLFRLLQSQLKKNSCCSVLYQVLQSLVSEEVRAVAKLFSNFVVKLVLKCNAFKYGFDHVFPDMDNLKTFSPFFGGWKGEGERGSGLMLTCLWIKTNVILIAVIRQLFFLRYNQTFFFILNYSKICLVDIAFYAMEIKIELVNVLSVYIESYVIHVPPECFTIYHPTSAENLIKWQIRYSVT